MDSIVASRDNKVRTVVVKYYNYPSKKAKFATVDVRSLSLIPNLKKLNLIPNFKLGKLFHHIILVKNIIKESVISSK